MRTSRSTSAKVGTISWDIETGGREAGRPSYNIRPAGSHPPGAAECSRPPASGTRPKAMCATVQTRLWPAARLQAKRGPFPYWRRDQTGASFGSAIRCPGSGGAMSQGPQNELLSCLPADERERLQARLEPVELALRQVLHAA